MADAICKWTMTGDGVWESDCGNGFWFEEGTPDENNFVFCPFCGDKIVFNRWAEDGRCIYCGAGDDNHHSFECPTGLHPDVRRDKEDI
jgi:hypothetical protein